MIRRLLHSVLICLVCVGALAVYSCTANAAPTDESAAPNPQVPVHGETAREAVGAAESLGKQVLQDVAAAPEHIGVSERLRQIRDQFLFVWDYPLGRMQNNPLTFGQLILALLIIVAGYLLTRVITRHLRIVLERHGHIDLNASATVLRLVRYGLLAFFLLFAMYTVNIPLTVFTLFGGALAIGVGFGAQNIINNFICGLILMFDRPIRIGDVIEIDGKAGQVEEIGARCSRLRLASGIDVLVPNSAFLEQKVVNWTLSDRKCRFSVKVGVLYGVSTHDVEKLIMKAVEEHDRILKEPAPVVILMEFGDNGLQFEVFFWLQLSPTTDSRVICSDVRHKIDILFREAGIEIAHTLRGSPQKIDAPNDASSRKPEEQKQGDTEKKGSSG